jgi:hypothetical protein
LAAFSPLVSLNFPDLAVAQTKAISCTIERVGAALPGGVQLFVDDYSWTTKNSVFSKVRYGFDEKDEEDLKSGKEWEPCVTGAR